MGGPKLSGFMTGTAVALALAVASPVPGVAGQGETAAAADSAQGTGRSPEEAGIESRIPLPQFIELAPLTPADVGAAEKPASAGAAETPAAAPRETAVAPSQAGADGESPPEVKTGSEASTPGGERETGLPPGPSKAAEKSAPRAPVETAPQEAAKSPADSPSALAVTRSVDIEGAIPVPEPANVPPPSLKDIGTPGLPAVDLAIAEEVRELVSGKLTRFLDRKRDREAVEAFYAARAFAPVWFKNGAPTPQMAVAVARLKAADADGLDASDYPTPDVSALATDPGARAEAELRLTSSILNYAHDAQAGRTFPSRISTNIEFSPPVPDPADVLQKVSRAENIAQALDGFNPQHEGFLALKRKLAELRGRTEEASSGGVTIPPGPTLRIGSVDERVPLLRRRLGVAGEGDAYDVDLADAVRAFQREHGLNGDGMVGPNTLQALNGGKRTNASDIKAVVSNMERWRWLPRNLGDAYVMVNVPDFTLKVVKNHKTVFRTRIVVGKPNTPTPSFAAAIENILVNPTWHVPQSIIYNEYLPALREDPTVLARMGLVMEHNRDGSISIRQPPGERNALGRIKFNFPNRFQVYLHDTPDKNLFSHERRAYSHGCMRVQNPTQFGEVLASIALPGENITAERLQSMFGTGERWLNFKHKIPVYLVYFNAYVDEAGKLVVRPDLYGYDQRVQSALRGQYVAAAERSQRVSPTAMRRARQIVQELPRPQPRGFFFPFPWLQ